MQGLTLQPSWHIYLPGGYRVSVEQWRSQFRQWTNIKEDQISRFTSECKENVRRCAILPWASRFAFLITCRRVRPVCPGGGAQWKSLNYSAGITITTYTMVAHSGRRSYEAQQMMDFLTGTEWGLVLLDEVHVVPANGTDPWSQVGHRCCWLVVTRGPGGGRARSPPQCSARSSPRCLRTARWA